jgi:type IV secretory pathway VirB10-like protein
MTRGWSASTVTMWLSLLKMSSWQVDEVTVALALLGVGLDAFWANGPVPDPGDAANLAVSAAKSSLKQLRHVPTGVRRALVDALQKAIKEGDVDGMGRVLRQMNELAGNRKAFEQGANADEIVKRICDGKEIADLLPNKPVDPNGPKPEAPKPADPKPGDPAPDAPASKWKWGNPKSKPTYGHTFLEHGQKVTKKQLADRARAKGHQVGQYLDDQSAADFIGDVAKARGPGVHDDVPLPQGMKTRVVLEDGTEVVADKARVVVKPDGSVRTSYPFSSAHPSGD